MKTTENSIQFLGAAGTVTGSKFLLTVAGKKILIDCGLFQGKKELRMLNWEELPADAHEIDIIILTHGHLDHVGYLPRLVAQGFKGRIIASEPTLAVAGIILKDSAKIQEEEAQKANMYKYSRHSPALPLYTTLDVLKTVTLFKGISQNVWYEIFDGILLRLRYNGHIIGSTFIEITAHGKTFVFSGDIGRQNDPLLFPPVQPEKADVLVIESTYGDKIHPLEDAPARLQAIILDTIAMNGTVIIPSFAVERTQLLMFLLWQLKSQQRLPDVPIYMDSPMATQALDIFHHFNEWHKLSQEDCAEMCRRIIRVHSPEESRTLIEDTTPKVVIAGSGMATGGRVLGYMQKYLEDSNSTILLVGYQAEGTRGSDLLQGKAEIKMYGSYYKVRARIASLESLSAHGDQSDLLHWMNGLKSAPENIFIVHGEPDSSRGLQEKIFKEYGWKSTVPVLNETVILG